MVLIISNKFDPHADKIILELKKQKCSFIRFNTEDFPQKILVSINFSDSYLSDNSSIHFLNLDKIVKISDLSSVYYRRPNPFKINPLITEKIHEDFALGECITAIQGLEYCLHCLWVSHPHNLRRAENKIYQLNTAKKIGFNTPLTLITNDPLQIKSFYEKCNDNNKGNGLVIKVLRHANTLGLCTRKVSLSDLEKSNNIKFAPCFFQEYIEKKIEVRITIVGKQIFAAEIHSQDDEKAKIDWRAGYDYVKYYPHELPAEIQSKCIMLLEEMQLAFGAIDMIITPDGQYIFLEINPNGQWLWIENFIGLPISKTLTKMLIQGKIN